MRAAMVAVAFVAAGVLTGNVAYAADILVTTTEQRVKGGPGCSLQEAMFAANLDASLSIVGLDAFGNTIMVPTNCHPGSGADRIVLPFRGLFPMAAAIV